MSLYFQKSPRPTHFNVIVGMGLLMGSFELHNYVVFLYVDFSPNSSFGNTYVVITVTQNRFQKNMMGGKRISYN